MCNGGNGHGQYLVVTQGGSAHVVTSAEIADMSFLGQISRVAGTSVFLKGYRWGPNDPHCCPSREATLEYRGGRLRLDKFPLWLSGSSAGCRRVYLFRGGMPGGHSPTRVTPLETTRNSCCRDLRQMSEVGVVRRPSVKARMRALAVVEIQIPADRGARLGDAVVGPQIDLLVFDRTPEPLDEHVVAPCPLA